MHIQSRYSAMSVNIFHSKFVVHLVSWQNNILQLYVIRITVFDNLTTRLIQLLLCRNKQSILGKLQRVTYDENMLVTTEDICNIVNKMKCGKSSGPDGISAESLKFSHPLLYVLLSLCFSLCYRAGHYTVL